MPTTKRDKVRNAVDAPALLTPPGLSGDLPAKIVTDLDRGDVAPGGKALCLEAAPVALGPVEMTGLGATPEEVVRVAQDGAPIHIGPTAYALVRASRRVVDDALAQGIAVYGLNTGLGPRRNERVSPELLIEYQRHIVLSHAGAVGDPLDDIDVRAVLFARLVGLTRGGAGVSPEVVRGLADLLNAGVLPVVPEISSVGASDLAALAAVGEVLIGRGLARYRGEQLPGGEALQRAGLEPVPLQPKDALSLISANAVSIGIGALAAMQAQAVAKLADLAGALTLEALAGNLSPFDPEVQDAKPFPGQRAAAANVLSLLAGSYLHRPGAPASLQDPLSLRTIPQVHGAFRQQAWTVTDAVRVELNSRSDNPLVSPATGRTLSNGNFQPMVLALAFESLRVGAAHVGSISERRTAKLATAHVSSTTIDSQLRAATGDRILSMTVAYSAATLSSQLKQLAVPVSLALPSLGQDVEDHGTLAPVAVLQARRSLDNLELMLTIEIVLAATLLAARAEPVRLGAGSWLAYDLVARLATDLRYSTTAELVAGLRAELVGCLIPNLPEPAARP
jgi:histidine ammonia-lyase